MKKFSVFSVMLVVLLALGLALAACDSSGDGGGGSGGGVDTGGDETIVMNILNNDSRDVTHIKVEQDPKVIYDRDYTIKAGATAAVNINIYSNIGLQFLITFTFSDGGNSWLYWYKGAIENEVMKTDPYH